MNKRTLKFFHSNIFRQILFREITFETIKQNTTSIYTKTLQIN